MLDKFYPCKPVNCSGECELYLRKIEKMEEEYQPNKSVIAAEKKSRERTSNQTAKVGGVPGVASNIPTTGGTRDVRPETPNRVNESEREESQITYEVSKSVSKIIEPFGDIKKYLWP